jgi:hypothetical protein
MFCDAHVLDSPLHAVLMEPIITRKGQNLIDLTRRYDITCEKQADSTGPVRSSRALASDRRLRRRWC